MKKINSSRSFIDSENSFSPKTPKPIIYNDKIRYITLNPINKKLTSKEKDENFSELGSVDAIWSKLFFWASKKQERRKEFLRKLKRKFIIILMLMII